MRFVILGGTGSLGRELARQILKRHESASILVFSRDDHKHKQMAAALDCDPRLTFAVGSVCDPGALSRVIQKGDVIFHVAALKHVDSGELNPEEYVATDLLGTIAVADVAIRKRAKCVVFSSSDKAVEPVNVYGACKFISERILLRRNQTQSNTRFSVYRWGNVLGSNGSILKTFSDSLAKSGTVPLTHASMTRFWIEIDRAAAFMLDTYETADRIMIPPIKAATVLDIAASLARVRGVPYRCVETGVRLGEKMHESLLSRHEGEPMESKNYPRYSDQELDKMIISALRGAE